MKFIPFNDKIEIRPMKKKSVIASPNESLIEAGEVLAIGEDVKFVKVGDIVYFDSWGHSKTPEIDGEIHYVVFERSEVIIGKSTKAD
jgi:co-chaperonin GroES (HSP10)